MQSPSDTIATVAPPAVYTRTYTSAEEYAAVNGLVGIRVNGPFPREFHACFTYMDLGVVKLRCGEASAGLNLVGSVSDNHVFTFGTRPARTRLMAGREVSHEHLFHPRPNEVFTTRSPGDAPFPWGSLVTSYEALACEGSRLAGRAVAPALNDAALVRATPVARTRLLRLLEDAVRLAAAMPEVADSPKAARAFAGVVLEALVDCLSGGSRGPDRAAVRRHNQVMTRLEGVVRADCDAALTLSGLCGAVGVSERTLHEVCMSFAGMPPMRYARQWRLSAMRTALREADPRRDSVSEIMLRHGFWEPGRVTAAYRQVFGETPSATLRRAAQA
ncbi:MAG TPA: helix-turn-helix domain-containing protein [Acetobacteraceae bacterium]|jgi:AraC-like DNA-binding protein